MVFGDEWLSSPKPFISSPRLLCDEHDFVTLSLSLKVIVMNLFVTELFYRTKEKNLFVMHMFRHPIFSSPIVLFVDKIFHHSIFIYFIFFLIKLWGDNIILSPNFFVTKRFICWQNILSQIFLFYLLFFLLSCGVTILFYHLMFSSPNVLFVDKIFLFSFLSFLLSCGVTILFCHQIFSYHHFIFYILLFKI